MALTPALGAAALSGPVMAALAGTSAAFTGLPLSVALTLLIGGVRVAALTRTVRGPLTGVAKS